jgi:hypothetical protein
MMTTLAWVVLPIDPAILCEQVVLALRAKVLRAKVQRRLGDSWPAA